MMPFEHLVMISLTVVDIQINKVDHKHRPIHSPKQYRPRYAAWVVKMTVFQRFINQPFLNRVNALPIDNILGRFNWAWRWQADVVNNAS